MRGSATPLLVVLVVLTGIMVVEIGRLGQAAVSRAQAQTAADAAALAGAAEGRPAAEEVAAVNRGRLLEYRQAEDETRVVVEVGAARASSRAHRGRGCATGSCPSGEPGSEPAPPHR
jgi:uncharacterized membrane protein